MSSYLAPIHTWVFNKIKLFEELEFTLVNAYEKKYGGEIREMFNDYQDKYGKQLENKPVEDLIDTSNIHGWLQNQIDTVETRQAAFLTEVFNRYKTEAVDLALEIYSRHGSDCGVSSKSLYSIDTAPDIYKALNSFLLDGMPCDIVNTITVNNNDKIEWQNTRCLHRGYWESIKADIKVFYRLRFSWVKAFVKTSNNDFTYNVYETEINGLPGFIHEIIRNKS